MSATISRLTARLAIIVALVATTLFVGVAGAWAEPAEPWLTVAELQDLLDNPGGDPVEGYFKTVLKGKDVVELDVTVKAITYGSQTGPVSGAALIYFETDDPRLTEKGGIASGMSGSPLYVNDNGTDKLVGAVSYGDAFTPTAAFATPVESMAAIENYPTGAAASISQLDRLVLSGTGVTDKVVITTDPEAHAADALKGTIVASPLSAFSVGGINPQAKIFKEYSTYLKSRGFSVVSGPATGMSSMTHPLDEPLEGGSAIAAMATRGDLWAGGIGTATYKNGANVLAFGHPMVWSGRSGLSMTNAWVDAVLPSEMVPYKVARPAALRGTITQDRLAGIMGVEGQAPVEIPVTAKATLGSESAETTVMVPAMVMNAFSWDFYGLPTMGAYVAGSRLFDQYTVPGSATTTTTVVVKDGSQTWTIVRTNRFDSAEDIPYEAVSDVAMVVGSLQFLSDNGIAKPQIQSVHLDTTFSTNRNLTEIKSVDVAGGLKYGANKAVVTYAKWGHAQDMKRDVWFTIPTNVPLTGALTATGAYDDGGDGEDDEEGMFDEPDELGYIDRTTTKEMVDELKKVPTNDTLTVTFQPVSMEMPAGEEDEDEPETYKPIEVSVRTGSVVVGRATKVAPSIQAIVAPSSTLPYYSYSLLTGMVVGSEGGGTLTVSRRYAGQANWASQGKADFVSPTVFEALLDPMTRNATLRMTYSGDKYTLAATKDISVKVAAKVKLAKSASTIKRGKKVTLTATVSPKDSGGKVVFERYSGGRWKTIATKSVVAGKAVYKYKAPLGKNTLRARTVGSSINASGKSSKITVKVVKK